MQRNNDASAPSPSSSNSTSTTTSALRSSQPAAVTQPPTIAGPKIYKLALQKKDGDPVRFMTLGCQGKGSLPGSGQAKVAALMNDVAALDEYKPDFVLLLGDNVYSWGIGSPTDPALTNCFDDVYLKPKLRNINGLPFFVILGNHDHNLHSKMAVVKEHGIGRAMNQVLHTYEDSDKRAIYGGPGVFKLAVARQPKTYQGWNMPSRFYGLDIGDTVIFCVDSDTYAHDFLTDAKTNNNDPHNQANWLAKEVLAAQAANKKVILAMHHPLHTLGKRAYKQDNKLYLSDTEIAQAQQLFPNFDASTQPINTLLSLILAKQGLTFDLVLTAHDHSNYYVKNSKHTQLTVGGGGGTLQHRAEFSTQNDVGLYAREHGFAVVTCHPNQPDLQLDVITTTRNHLRLTTSSKTPITTLPNTMSHAEEQQIKKFRKAVLAAVNAYLQYFLGAKQDKHAGRFFKKGNASHGPKGVDRVHKVWTCVNRYKIDSYRNLVEEVAKLCRRHTPPTHHSFINILNDKIRAAYRPMFPDQASTHDIDLRFLLQDLRRNNSQTNAQVNHNPTDDAARAAL